MLKVMQQSVCSLCFHSNDPKKFLFSPSSVWFSVGSSSSINSCSSWSWNPHNPCLSLFFIFAHRRRERRLHHSVVHRADLAFWGSESGRKGLVGVGYRESDPGQSAVLWEWQKQGKQNTFCPISKPSGGQQQVLLHWRNKSTVPRTVQQKYPLLGPRKDCSSWNFFGDQFSFFIMVRSNCYIWNYQGCKSTLTGWFELENLCLVTNLSVGLVPALVPCLCAFQARRSSQSEAVALQAIRNTKGNGLCVDCEASSEFMSFLQLLVSSMWTQ